MKITQLRRAGLQPQDDGAIRGTEGQDTVIGVPSPRRRILLYAALATSAAVLAAGIWLLVAWSRSKYSVSAEQIQLATVTRGPFVRDVAADGTVIAAVNPTLFSSAPGTVQYLVHSGDKVANGQPLAVVDSPELRNEYQRQVSTLQELTATLEEDELQSRWQSLSAQRRADTAEIQIRAAQREEERSHAAWEKHVISQRDFDRARDDSGTAKLSFEQARDTAEYEHRRLLVELRIRRAQRERQMLTVDSLKRRVDQLTARAPVDGIVASLAQFNGARVLEGAAVLTVVALTDLQVEFALAEVYSRDLRPGMRAEITVDGQVVGGTVTTVSPEVKQGEVTGRIAFTPPQPPGLRQNQRVSVRIVLDKRDNVLQFERGALMDEHTRALYLLRQDHAVRIPVELGKSSVNATEAIRGLAVGDRVVISDTREWADAPEVFVTR